MHLSEAFNHYSLEQECVRFAKRIQCSFTLFIRIAWINVPPIMSHEKHTAKIWVAWEYNFNIWRGNITVDFFAQLHV